MQLVYTAGKYRDISAYNVQKNIEKARDVAMKYWKLGYAVICPHMNSANMDGEFLDHVWLDGDLEMVRRCDIVVMVPGWETSVGAQG